MRLDHFSLSAPDIEPLKDFFCDVIGLRVGERPGFEFPGYWLYGDDGTAVVHLIQGQGNSRGNAGGEASRPGGDTGVVDHLAFGGTDAEALIRRIEAGGWTYRRNTLPGGGTRQVFIDGPDGLVVEVAFRP